MLRLLKTKSPITDETGCAMVSLLPWCDFPLPDVTFLYRRCDMGMLWLFPACDLSTVFVLQFMLNHSYPLLLQDTKLVLILQSPDPAESTFRPPQSAQFLSMEPVTETSPVTPEHDAGSKYQGTRIWVRFLVWSDQILGHIFLTHTHSSWCSQIRPIQVLKAPCYLVARGWGQKAEICQIVDLRGKLLTSFLLNVQKKQVVKDKSFRIAAGNVSAYLLISYASRLAKTGLRRPFVM